MKGFLHLPFWRFFLGFFIFFAPPKEGLAQWIDGRELNFHVSVSIQGDDTKKNRTSLSIYEKILTTDSRGILHIAEYRSNNGIISKEAVLPYPSKTGTRRMNFDFPTVQQNDPKDPIRLEFFESIIFILGRDMKDRKTVELNLSEFVIEDKSTKRLIETIINTGQIVDEEGRSRRVLGLGIDLAFNKLNIPQIEADMDSMKIKPENIRLEVDKLPDRSLGEHVIRLDDYRSLWSTPHQGTPTDIITLKDLRARCQVVYRL